MNLEYKHLLSKHFPPQSKVWVYQASRLLGMAEAFQAEELLENFLSQWKSHNKSIMSEGHIFFGQFLVIIADETNAHIGGCATDESTRFIKALAQQLSIDFLDRNSLAFFMKDKVQLLPYSQINYAIENGFINTDTLYFNNLVSTKEELEHNWIIPVGKSWIGKRLGLVSNA